MAEVGRPTTYEPLSVIAGVTSYIQECKDALLLPSVEGLAVKLGAARSTLYKWADEHSEFSDILELLLSQQAAQLIQNGLVGNYNATITKLMLTKHGYKDRSDLTTNDVPIVAGFNLLTHEGNNANDQADA